MLEKKRLIALKLPPTAWKPPNSSRNRATWSSPTSNAAPAYELMSSCRQSPTNRASGTVAPLPPRRRNINGDRAHKEALPVAFLTKPSRRSIARRGEQL